MLCDEIKNKTINKNSPDKINNSYIDNEITIQHSIIEKIGTVNERWNNWNPIEEHELILKNAINNTEDNFSQKK